jgi:subtilisin family serine protease
MGTSLRDALKRMRAIAGDRSVSADPLHFASGSVKPGAAGRAAPLSAPSSPLLIGIIDGGVDSRAIERPLVQQAFAAGGPSPNAHATAIASLLQGTPAIRGAAPQARLLIADVYGRDPAGGSATAIARAIGWMVRQRVPVVAVSLVGPANPLLARVVAAARARGTVIVAAVGNDGPAAPPAYPASYPEALAVTGVDGRSRALIEAGRARHLDYAAPGADMLAAGLAGRPVAVRGTSFAVPFAAARLARFYAAPDSAALAGALRALDREAQDLGKSGADQTYGRGLVCGDCRTPNK